MAIVLAGFVLGSVVWTESARQADESASDTPLEMTAESASGETNLGSINTDTPLSEVSLHAGAKHVSDALDTPANATILDAASESVANYINRSYRVPLKEARKITSMAVETGETLDIDPLLILAVIATESSFNPNARSAAGAEGLMQVMTKIHADKFERFGGNEAAFDPQSNIVVGSEILSQLIHRTGSVRTALKWYSGAANLSHDRGYSAQVLRERTRLMVAASGDSDLAVRLSRTKTTAPNTNLMADANRSTLPFSSWRTLTQDDSVEVQSTSSAPKAEGQVSVQAL